MFRLEESAAFKWLRKTKQKSDLSILSTSSTKRKAEKFDIPTLAKKIKTGHVYSHSSSFDNLMSTSSSGQSQYPTSPEIH